MAVQRSALVWLWISVVIFIVDITTKIYMESILGSGRVIDILPVLEFRLAHNNGSAFGFLADMGGWQRWGFSAIALIVSGFLITWMKKTPAANLWLAVSLTFILGGAVGNLYDRIAYGHVIDFIHVYWYQINFDFPIFNVADIAITIGALMMAIDVVREFFQERRQAES